MGCGKIILKAVLVVASESNKGQKIRDSGDKYTGKDLRYLQFSIIHKVLEEKL